MLNQRINKLMKCSKKGLRLHEHRNRGPSNLLGMWSCPRLFNSKSPYKGWQVPKMSCLQKDSYGEAMTTPDKGNIPKTSLCCGLKPKRVFYQTSFRDDEGYWRFSCRMNCGKSIQIENNYRGTSKAEFEATLKWNES